MAVQHTFKVKRGDAFRQKITVTEGGQPVDITDWTIFFTIKRNKTDSDDDAVVKKTITTHTDPANGISYILILPSELDGLLGKYYYDLQIKRPMTEPEAYDDIETLLEGQIVFAPDITRRTT